MGCNSGTIENCYATGDVSSYYAGGLVGYQKVGNIINSYRCKEQTFDITVGTTTTSTPTNALGIPKSMEILQTIDFQNATLGWSSDCWTFVDGEHPTLKNVGTTN